MRKLLHAGTWRHRVAFLSGAIGGLCMWWFWTCVFGARVLENGSKVAFVSAAFAVTAYNLRTRVVDLILKIEATPTKTAGLSSMAKGCGKRLTNLVLLFIITASLMGCLNFFAADNWGRGIAALAAFMFLMSGVHFVYVIFAFERLEAFILDDAVERATKKERQRLSKPQT